MVDDYGRSEASVKSRGCMTPDSLARAELDDIERKLADPFL
jgi:hypothetical protein